MGMRYANGREPNLGDVVRGRGYTLAYEITGVLFSMTPNMPKCNCSIATVSHRSDVWIGVTHDDLVKGYMRRIDTDRESGDLDAFVAIDPRTGEVLPAEG